MLINIAITNKLYDKFRENFNQEPQFYRAPGRINLIGEHTDYNNGFVLPASIDKAIYFAVAPNTTKKFRFFSLDYNEYFEIDTEALEKSNVHWANYLIGVAAQFAKKGFRPEGLDCVFGGDIPLGAGLSSSAALECGFAFCLNEQYGFGIGGSDLILMAQKAEHEYAGVMCGIMDQFASVYGKEAHVIKLDCRNLDYMYYPFSSSDINIVLCDTKVKHTLASSEYNIRRRECENGVRLLQNKFPEIRSLRDATADMLEIIKDSMEKNVYDRCHYVIHEISRVEKACQALEENDFTSLGKLMYETHDGLSIEYKVSCKELDCLVELARNSSDVLGARMMGGGFGGCTINLIKKQGTKSFLQLVQEEYPRLTGNNTEIYMVNISGGVEKINP